MITPKVTKGSKSLKSSKKFLQKCIQQERVACMLASGLAPGQWIFIGPAIVLHQQV